MLDSTEIPDASFDCWFAPVVGLHSQKSGKKERQAPSSVAGCFEASGGERIDARKILLFSWDEF